MDSDLSEEGLNLRGRPFEVDGVSGRNDMAGGVSARDVITCLQAGGACEEEQIDGLPRIGNCEFVEDRGEWVDGQDFGQGFVEAVHKKGGHFFSNSFFRSAMATATA